MEETGARRCGVAAPIEVRRADLSVSQRALSVLAAVAAMYASRRRESLLEEKATWNLPINLAAAGALQ
jgi:hypothetical protein